MDIVLSISNIFYNCPKGLLKQIMDKMFCHLFLRISYQLSWKKSVLKFNVVKFLIKITI